jgi:hypothetical protein
VYDSNLIVNKGISLTDYFKQKMEAKLNPKPAENVEEEKQKKKNKRKFEEEVDEVTEVPLEEETAEVNEDVPVKKSKKKKKAISEEEQEIVEEVIEEPPKKKKKSKKNREQEELETVEEVPVAEESSLRIKKKKKSKKEPEVEENPVEEPTKSSKKKKKNETPEPPQCPTQSKPAGETERGANAVYSTNVIQIPSYVAQKLSSMTIHNFKNANLAQVVGYGLSEDIEIKTVQTKIGQNADSTDKYALYNMDRMTTRQKTNPRKIISKLKRTKKSIQVI